VTVVGPSAAAMNAVVVVLPFVPDTKQVRRSRINTSRTLGASFNAVAPGITVPLPPAILAARPASRPAARATRMRAVTRRWRSLGCTLGG
jgi:hypothetical protein